MLKVILTAVMVVFSLSGCLWGTQQTKFEKIVHPPEKNIPYIAEEWNVHSSSDAVVTFKIEGVEIQVDNRGRPSTFSEFLNKALESTPTLEIGTGGN